MMVKSLHHVAYRCKDAQETVDFYTNVLGLEFSMAVAEDRVPSTREYSPYMHIFFGMEDGSCIAFFELPEADPMGRDQNTPRNLLPCRCCVVVQRARAWRGRSVSHPGDQRRRYRVTGDSNVGGKVGRCRTGTRGRSVWSTQRE